MASATCHGRFPGDVTPTNSNASSSASPGRVSGARTAPSPTVAGGPISDCPTSASTIATRSPRACHWLASHAVNVVFPASVAPMTITTRAASNSAMTRDPLGRNAIFELLIRSIEAPRRD